MGNTCYAAPRTELDNHIDRFHKHGKRPVNNMQPSISQSHFTEHDDSQSKAVFTLADSFHSAEHEKPTQRVSRLLEPIALRRQREDYLQAIESKGWVTVDPNSHKDKVLRYQLNSEH